MNKVISALMVPTLLVLAVGCSGGCATTGKPSVLTERQIKRMVIFKNDQQCEFLVTDPEGEMFLTVITPEENVEEFSPKVHTMIIFSDSTETPGFKNIAFAATVKLDAAEQEMTVTIVDYYRINQLMFQMLVEKYNIIHIDEEDISAQENEDTEPEEEGTVKPSNSNVA